MFCQFLFYIIIVPISFFSHQFIILFIIFLKIKKLKKVSDKLGQC